MNKNWTKTPLKVVLLLIEPSYQKNSLPFPKKILIKNKDLFLSK